MTYLLRHRRSQCSTVGSREQKHDVVRDPIPAGKMSLRVKYLELGETVVVEYAAYATDLRLVDAEVFVLRDTYQKRRRHWGRGS